LWLAKEIPDYSKGLDTDEKTTEWTHYKLGTGARIEKSKKFKAISIDDLLPENFEQHAELVKDRKRPIFRFSVSNNGIEERIYAKGSQITWELFYAESKPSYRLTPLAGVRKASSKAELEITRKLMQAGIKGPEIVGTYISDFEDFFFLKEVEGKRPDLCFEEHREEMIRQDAVMLARLCRLGYRKQGFEDFDDKVFNGNDLYLIDAEEIVDLYSYIGIDFREIILDPTGKDLRKFRRYQRSFFKLILKDAIYIYRDTLLPEEQHKVRYIESFFKEFGWKKPTTNEINRLLTFPKNYQTYGSFIAMMLDTD
jgi:hypothetical protein